MVEALRVGCGSAYSEDRIDLALEMADRGGIAYLCMDGLAERTLSLAHQRRDARTGEGSYDTRMPDIAGRLLPVLVERGVKLIANIGAANPIAAGRYLADEAKRNGLTGISVGVISGDDVSEYVRVHDPVVLETGRKASELKGAVVAANAYIGAEPIVEALRLGATVIVGGRIADPSLYVAPIVHEFGWALDDWSRLGAATVIGHLLECGTYATGASFADPPYRIVESFEHLSFPLADVRSDGSAMLSKLPGTDGLLTVDTCKMQLGYEIHDPARYFTPDVTADFSQVRLRTVDGGIAVDGGSGTPRPRELKGLIAIDEGFIGEGQVSFAGHGALSRARLGEQIVRGWLKPLLDSGAVDDFRIDLLGVNAIHGGASEARGEPYEVHVRVAGRARDRKVAAAIAQAGWDLQIHGPAGGGGHRKEVRPVIAMYTCSIPRSAVTTTVEIVAE
ncbi:MAG: acyclic terpene utilization AtuA family protein [Candidatus Acidiferrales bacterium]